MAAAFAAVTQGCPEPEPEPEPEKEECAVPCAAVNGLAECAADGCTLACFTGFGDCDGDPGNGCEVDLRSDAEHCAACENRCEYPGGQGRCEASVCVAGGCSDGFGDCDGDPENGCEVDLSVSPDHCGSCGTSCGAGPCVDRQCGAEPEHLFDGAVSTFDMDAQFIYATYGYGLEPNEGYILRIPRKGGPGETILSDLDKPWHIRLDAGALFFGELGMFEGQSYPPPSRISRMPLGGTPAVVAEGGDMFALAGSHVYYAVDTDISSVRTIRRAPKQGGAPETLVKTEVVESLVVDAGVVFWAERDLTSNPPPCSGAIRSLPAAGGEPTTLVSFGSDVEAHAPHHIAVDADFVYFTASRCPGPFEGAMVGRVPRGGGPIETLVDGASPTVTFPYAIALAGDHVFFTNIKSPEGPGSVAKVPKEGGPSVFVATKQERPDFILAADDGIYFKAGFGIYRVPR